jgi:hypothetical protein
MCRSSERGVAWHGKAVTIEPGEGQGTANKKEKSHWRCGTLKAALVVLALPSQSASPVMHGPVLMPGAHVITYNTMCILGLGAKQGALHKLLQSSRLI